MVDRSRLNRLSPPLMHVFREAHRERTAGDGAALENPKPLINARRSRAGISERDLRSEVQRDLETLMNSIALESTLDLSDFPAVRGSVLNYGFPSIGHLTLDSAGVEDLTQKLTTALIRYEPRLLRKSIEVSRQRDASNTGMIIRFLVRAELFCDPQNVPVEFFADVEVQSGTVAVERR